MYTKKWTKEENKILFSCIEDNSTNFSEAFRQCAEKISRTPLACSFHFQELRRKEKLPVLMVNIGKRKRITNGKLTYVRKGKKCGKADSTLLSKWKRIIKILFE